MQAVLARLFSRAGAWHAPRARADRRRRSMCRAAATLGGEALEPRLPLTTVGTQGFGNIGVTTVNTGNINTATVFTRQNTTVFLITGRTNRGPTAGSSDPYDAMHLVEHLRDASGTLDARECVRSVASFALGAEPGPARIAELERYLESIGGSPNPTMNNERMQALLCLITAMPEYQLC